MKQKIVFILGIFIISFFSCTNNKENSSLNLTEVRIGVHNNAGGISLGGKRFFYKIRDKTGVYYCRKRTSRNGSNACG